jgi:hypothetical protein
MGLSQLARGRWCLELYLGVSALHADGWVAAYKVSAVSGIGETICPVGENMT